jgi:hypothetical protein
METEILRAVTAYFNSKEAAEKYAAELTGARVRQSAPESLYLAARMLASIEIRIHESARRWCSISR